MKTDQRINPAIGDGEFRFHKLKFPLFCIPGLPHIRDTKCPALLGPNGALAVDC
jgi:hypothetical protein